MHGRKSMQHYPKPQPKKEYIKTLNATNNKRAITQMSLAWNSKKVTKTSVWFTRKHKKKKKKKNRT
jgi:hypothetical protein